MSEMERMVRELLTMVVHTGDCLQSCSKLTNQSELRRGVAVLIYSWVYANAHVPPNMIEPGSAADALTDVLIRYFSEKGPLPENFAQLVVADTMALIAARRGSGKSVLEQSLPARFRMEGDEELFVELGRLELELRRARVLFDEIFYMVTPYVSSETIERWRSLVPRATEIHATDDISDE